MRQENVSSAKLFIFSLIHIQVFELGGKRNKFSGEFKKK